MRLRAGGACPVAILQARAAQLGQSPPGGLILCAGVAIAEIAVEIERQSLGQAAASREPPRGDRRSDWPSPAARSSRGCDCLDAAAPRRRAWHGCAAPRTHPAAPLWRARARAHRRWPRTAAQIACRGRPSRCCERDRGGRRGAAAPRTDPPDRTRRANAAPSARRGRRRAITDRCAQPVRQTRPSAWSSTACSSTDGSARSAAIGSCAGALPGGALTAHGSVRERDDPAEIAPATPVAHEQRDMARASPGPRPRGQIDLGAVDRSNTVRLGGLGQLHRARKRVVVGQRHRPIAQLARAPRQLLRQRDAVQKGVRRVAVQLRVRGRGQRHHLSRFTSAA